MLNQNYSTPITTPLTVNNDNTFAALTPENIEFIAQLVKNMQLENVAQAAMSSAYVELPMDQSPLIHYQSNVQNAASCLKIDNVESPTFSRLVDGKLLPNDYMCHLCFLKV